MKLNTRQFISSSLIGMIVYLASCTKDPKISIPGNGTEAYVNFFNGSEAILNSDPADLLGFNNTVYINDSIPNSTFLRYPQFPNSLDLYREYPRFASGTELGPNGEVLIPPGTNYHVLFWMPIASGDYRFIFTSGKKVYLKDINVKLAPKSFTAQYLVESPETDDAYRIVTAPVERKGTSGKIRIQVVNLATDLGKIDVYRSGKDGNAVSSDLPSGLNFGDYSTYTELDTSGSATTNKLIFLKIRKSGTTEALLSTAIPAIPGSSFTIMVQGFSRQTTRRIKSSNTEYKTVIVNPNLRISIRRAF